MNTLFEAMNTTAETDNGCKAHHSSLSANLDLFYLAGASRGKDIKQEFKTALIEDSELALRTLQWLRDVRGGAGERQLFRELLVEAINYLGETNDKIIAVVGKIPEIGRFDDLIWINENSPLLKDFACHILIESLRSNNGLAFKWTPIKGVTAKKLRNTMGFKNEKDWRKYVVAGRKTVEQQMCAKDWDNIEFGKLPSVASARYQKAFGRNATEKYGEYINALVKGEAKINASAVYPYDIYKSCFSGNAEVANEQWKALPNYLEGNTERLLPVIDVSGSMTCPAGGSSLSCMDVAISLGWYIANRNECLFKNIFVTFHTTPQMLKVNDQFTLKETFELIKKAPWGGSTDIQKTFQVLLQAATEHNVPEDQMPTQIVIFSDMQFNTCDRNGSNATMFKAVEALYEQAGYKMPKLVYWNLNAQNKTIPVTKDTNGTALVSGFSPSLMKGILKGGMTPEQVMLDTIMIDRYSL